MASSLQYPLTGTIHVDEFMVKMVIEQLKNKHNLPLDAEQAKLINGLIVKEYMNEFYGRVA